MNVSEDSPVNAHERAHGDRERRNPLWYARGLPDIGSEMRGKPYNRTSDPSMED